MSELDTKNNSELLKTLSEKRKSLDAFYTSINGSKTRNVREGRGIRKEIARILTSISLKKGKQK